MGTPFGFMAFLGVASLIGVIVSHVIVLFDFIEEMHEKGEPLERALPDAGIERIRPVMITVGATILALFPLALERGPLGLLRDFCPGPEADYVAHKSQRTVVGFCRVSSPLRFRSLLSHGVAPPKITLNDSPRLRGGSYDQIPRTIIPRTSLHCRDFLASARYQRPHVRVCLAWRHRVHCGLLRDSGPLHHPFSLLQALKDPWQQQQTKELSARRAITRLIGGGSCVKGLANYCRRRNGGSCAHLIDLPEFYVRSFSSGWNEAKGSDWAAQICLTNFPLVLPA